MKKAFSIIVPVLNEAVFLKQHHKQFKSFLDAGHEVIIIDGGSNDNSVALCNSIGCKVFTSKPSRGFQQHLGALQSNNEVLLFLHADTLLPENAFSIILQALTTAKDNWGRFDIEFSNTNFIYKVIAWLMNKRSCLTGIVTGDHIIFTTRKHYFETGGFSDIPIMEDIELSKRLKLTSKPICLPQKAVTSSRKWEQQGVVRIIFKMWFLRMLFFFGVSSKRLARMYYT